MQCSPELLALVVPCVCNEVVSGCAVEVRSLRHRVQEQGPRELHLKMGSILGLDRGNIRIILG